MRLILTHYIASLEQLTAALGSSLTPLEIVIADDPEGVKAQIAEGELNVVLVPAASDLAALRQVLSTASLGERPLVLMVDARPPGNREEEDSCAATRGEGLSASVADVGGLSAEPMDWMADAGQQACQLGARTTDSPREDSLNLRQWLDALSKVTEGAVLRVEDGRCVALDPSFPAKLGFRPVLKEGVRIGQGFAVEDRRLMLEWLKSVPEFPPAGVIPIGQRTKSDQLVFTMRGSHGYHSVLLERIPCTSAPASSRILLASQASEADAAPMAVSALGGLLDAETGLAGAEVFLERVRLAVGRARRDLQSCAVLACRLDGLDRIERKLGKEAMATAFQTAATRLRRAGGDVESMARLGPHEFGFVFVSTDPVSVVEQQILRFQRAIAPPLTSGDHPMSATLRFGMSECSEKLMRPKALVRQARTRAAAALLLDHALPRLKRRSGTGAPTLGVPLEREIEQACIEHQFEVFLQPVIHLRSFQVRGAEVLVRWRHPVRGLLAPVHFLPIAESTGQISQIGQWVLGEVCSKASHWSRLFPARARFAVNVSPVELHDSRFLATTLAILGRHELGNAEVELEITETAVLASEQKTSEIVECLRRQGVKVALDDFGVGYSSLAHLKEIPFSKLKIDRTFVHGSTASHRCRTIVRSMVELGKGLRVEVNAEGVETAEQLRFLYEAGCDEVQGYLFARPMAPNRFESWVAGYQGKALGAFEDMQAGEGLTNILPFTRSRQS